MANKQQKNKIPAGSHSDNSRLSRKRFPRGGSGSMQISPLRFEDIETVAELSQRYFPMSRKVSKKYIQARLVDLYFKTDIVYPKLSSLVCRHNDGRIHGFLGITGKRFMLRGEEKLAANCHHLMATEYGRASMAPMRLLQHFLKGPQDFSFADGSVKSTRLIWERLGGVPSFVNSIYYKVPLRPLSFISRLLEKNLNSVAHTPVKHLFRGGDFIGSNWQLPFFHRRKPNLELINLELSLLSEGLTSIKKHFELFPLYDLPKLEHLMRLLKLEKRYGTLQKFGFIDSENKLLGWFIYYSKTGGVCEVIQAVSLPGYENELYQMLAWHAYEQGGIELSGRVMAGQIGSGFTNRSLSMPGRMWTLIHSSDTDLKLSIQSGNAFLTRLEGDLWLL